MADAGTEGQSEGQSDGRTVYIDLGKKKRKAVKQLRKGKGSLVQKVNDAVAALREEGQLGSNDNVVVVVERKARRDWRRFGL
jgi:hypothetical protein